MYQNKFSLFWRKLSNTVLLISALSLTLLARGQNNAPSSVNTQAPKTSHHFRLVHASHRVFQSRNRRSSAGEGHLQPVAEDLADPAIFCNSGFAPSPQPRLSQGHLSVRHGVPSVSSSTPTSSSFVLSATPATNLRYPGGLLPRGLMHALIPPASPLSTSSNRCQRL